VRGCVCMAVTREIPTVNRLFLALSFGCLAPVLSAQSLVTVGPNAYACTADGAQPDNGATSGMAAFWYDAATGVLRIRAWNTSTSGDATVLTHLWFTAPAGSVKQAELLAVDPPGTFELSFKKNVDGLNSGNGSGNSNWAECFGAFMFAISSGGSNHGIAAAPTEFTVQLSGAGVQQLTSESFATATAVGGDVPVNVAMRFATDAGRIVMANAGPALTATASCVIYNGNEINPVDLHCETLPVITTEWRLNTSPNPDTELAVLGLSLAPIAPTPWFDGELLIDMNQFDARISSGSFAFTVPAGLMGFELYLQAARIDDGVVVLLNAIHATLGL